MKTQRTRGQAWSKSHLSSLPQNIFKYLMMYFGELTSADKVDSTLIKSMTPHLWDMSQMFPAAAATYLQKWLLDKQKEYASSPQRRNGIHKCVHLNTVGFTIVSHF